MYKITKVTPEPNSKLKVTYSSGRTISIDMTERIKKGGVFATLADPAVFSQVKIGEHGRFLEWPGEVDLCADAIWYEGTGEGFVSEESRAS